MNTDLILTLVPFLILINVLKVCTVGLLLLLTKALGVGTAAHNREFAVYAKRKLAYVAGYVALVAVLHTWF